MSGQPDEPWDAFAILGVSRWATPQEIRAAYRRAAKRAHPDQGGSADAFQRVRDAADRLLAQSEAAETMAGESARRTGDRASADGDWGDVSQALTVKWGSAPTVVFAPPRIGLSSFAAGRELNPAAWRWLARTFGPRGEAWDFHTDGDHTRLFFRQSSDALRFRTRFS